MIPILRMGTGGSEKKDELPKVFREEEAGLGFEPRSLGTPGESSRVKLETG